ncbi:hypothetical protein ACHAPP_003952 [Verticillium nonalfalfae]
MAPSAVAILSIGDMGVGIAKLLLAKGFTVTTNIAGRSEDTAARARAAGIQLVASDAELVASAAVVLSVVPPRDARATAQRVVDALLLVATGERPADAPPLYYVDLNAVAPASARAMASLFDGARVPVRFVDGCIIGAPPRLLSSPDPGTNGTRSTPKADGTAGGKADADAHEEDPQSGWSVPGIPTAGPHALASLPTLGPRLSGALGAAHMSAAVGAASGLKMCFASLSKGLTALAVESFTTAHALGVLPLLRAELRARLPRLAEQAERAVVAVPPKAYRWVAEMEEISETHRVDGGFAGEALFRGAADVYRVVADETVLGAERIGKRRRGTTVEDVAEAVAEGLERKRKKQDQTVISISFIKRKAGTTPEQFYHHWEKVHGPLVRPWMKKHGFISYTQVHATPALNEGVAPIGPENAGPSPLAEYDGCAVFEVPSMEVFAAAFGDAYYRETIAPDEHNFIDKKAGVTRIRGEVKQIL